VALQVNAQMKAGLRTSCAAVNGGREVSASRPPGGDPPGGRRSWPVDTRGGLSTVVRLTTSAPRKCVVIQLGSPQAQLRPRPAGMGEEASHRARLPAFGRGARRNWLQQCRARRYKRRGSTGQSQNQFGEPARPASLDRCLSALRAAGCARVGDAETPVLGWTASTGPYMV